MRRAVLDQLVPPVLDLHAATWTARDRYEMRPDARRFETWEASSAQLGLGSAIDHALGWGLPRIQTRVVQRCGITTFTVDGADADRVKSSLARQGINISVSRTPSTRPDMDDRGLKEVLRASVHYYNTEDEIGVLIRAVRRETRAVACP